MSITVIPAIDLKGGRCVRLRQGLAGEETVYSDNPADVARQWEEQGGTYLHVVDLDGAFGGKPAHTDVIGEIVKAVSMPIEVGGGLRTNDDIDVLLEMGVDRAVVGTRVYSEPDTLDELIGRYGARLAVGIDARDGKVQVKGWTETTEETALALAKRADQAGLTTLIFTDTARDGMMQGVNVDAIDEVCATVRCSVIASGGVTHKEDFVSLNALGRKNLVGAIVGKALYEGVVTIQELQG